jgi:hypothetical protein
MHSILVPAERRLGKLGGGRWAGEAPADCVINVRVPLVADVVQLETCRKISPQPPSIPRPNVARWQSARPSERRWSLPLETCRSSGLFST